MSPTTPEPYEGFFAEMDDAKADIHESEEGTAAAVDRHHRDLMMDEGGDHYFTQDWRTCPGCQSDNPHYDAAGGRR